MTKPIKVSAAKVRSCWGDMIDKARYTHQPYLITKQNKPAVVMIGVDDYVDMLDAMDTMAEQLDSKFQKSLFEGKKDIEEGRGLSLGELKKSLKQ